MFDLGKKLGRIFIMASASSLVLPLVSCEDDKKPETNVATVSIEQGAITETSLAFTLSSSNADAVCYTWSKTGEVAPDAEQIFKKGEVALANETKEYTVKELEANVSYDIYAVAKNSQGYSQIAKATMKTAAPGASVSVQMGQNITSSSAEFTVIASNAKKAAWICVPAGGQMPDAAKILADGTEVEVGKTVSCKATGLEPSKQYVILAAASALEGTDIVVSKEVKFITTGAQAPKVGDFYYSDGTWSTELDKSKTPIAVVFFTGVAKDNGDNSAYYKLKDGVTPMTVNGYAIAINDATLVNGENIEVSWSFFDGSYEGAGCSFDVTDFVGYTNTQSITRAAKKRPGELTPNDDSFPAAYYATIAFEKACPAPESSSGWFLPSTGQFQYIWDYAYWNKQGTLSAWLENSFKVLVEAGIECTPLYSRDSEYWSSTEKYDSEAHSYWAYYNCFDESMFKPGFTGNLPKDKKMRVRSAIVF